jgi:hypothetical protein
MYVCHSLYTHIDTVMILAPDHVSEGTYVSCETNSSTKILYPDECTRSQPASHKHKVVHAYVHVCMYVCAHMAVHMYARKGCTIGCERLHMHTCIHAYMHTCIHAYSNVSKDQGIEELVRPRRARARGTPQAAPMSLRTAWAAWGVWATQSGFHTQWGG